VNTVNQLSTENF